ncbi:MAG: sulfotransferase family 2 domain-containing protein [Pseudomonadota bacterium]
MGEGARGLLPGRLLGRLFAREAAEAPEPAVAEAERAVRSPGRILFTTRRYPIYYLTITKCGCTYLKNLLYYLDHDHLHEHPEVIHRYADEDMVRPLDVPVAEIRQSPYAFAVVRDPVDRFLSLYFDKIYPDSPQSFRAVRKYLAQNAAIDLTPGLDAAAHTANCHRLIAWLDDNLARRTDMSVNPHWRWQTSRLKRAAEFDLTLLTLKDLDRQLRLLLTPLIPDIAAKMAAVTVRNVSARPVAKEAVLTEALLEEVNTVYARDREVYDDTVATWAERTKDLPPEPRPMARPLTAKVTPPRRAAPPALVRAKRLPLYALQIEGAGDAKIRDLFHRLDHQAAHPDPGDAAAGPPLRQLSVEQAASEQAGMGIVVLRSPVARFLEFYFAQIWRDGQERYAGLADYLASRGLSHDPDISVGKHRDNCRLLLEELEDYEEEMEAAPLRPQASFLADAATLPLIPVMRDRFGEQLMTLLGPVDPPVEEAIRAADVREPVAWPVAQRDVITNALRDRLRRIYAPDFALVAETRERWRSGAFGPG